MTNKLALFLAVVIVALFAADAHYFDWSNSVFLGRKSFALLDWIAFWR